MSASLPPTDPESAGAEPPFAAVHWRWIAAATLVAALLRFLNLGEWSIWVDEGHTWRDASLPLTGERGFLASGRSDYPLPFLLLRGLLAGSAIDSSEFGLRLPFALVGIASVPILSLCGRRMVGPAAAVAAAWLCAVHPWHLFWSQNARGYILMFVAAVLATHRIVAYADRGWSRDALWAMLWLALGVAAHPTGALVVAGAVMFLVLRPMARAESPRLLPMALLVLLLLTGTALVVVAYSPYQGFLIAKDDPDPVHLLQTTAYYFRPELLLAGGLGLVLCGLQWPLLRGLLVVCMLVVPLFALLAIGSTLAKTTARYAFGILPVWLLLAGRTVGPWFPGLPVAGVRRWLPPALAGVTLLAGSFAELVAYHGNQWGQRGRWREACDFVAAAAAAPGELPRLRVLTTNQPSVVYYLAKPLWSQGGIEDERVHVHALVGWEFDGEDKGQFLHEPGLANHLAWNRRLAAQHRQQLVVVVSRPELAEIEPTGALWQLLQREFRLVLHLPCWVGPKDESLYVFLPRESR